VFKNPAQPGSKPAYADFSNEPNHAFAYFNFQQKEQDNGYDGADNEKDKRRTKTHADHIFSLLTIIIWGWISGLSSFGRLHDDWYGGFFALNFISIWGKTRHYAPGLDMPPGVKLIFLFRQFWAFISSLRDHPETNKMR
jgi:hypothetical protein